MAARAPASSSTARPWCSPSKGWEAAVKDLIDGKGKAAPDGPNKAIFARADQSKHLWAAGLIPGEVAGMAKAMEAEPRRTFSVALDLADGMSFQAAVGLASADQAQAVKKKADEEGLAMVKGMLGPDDGHPGQGDRDPEDERQGRPDHRLASISHDDMNLKDKAGAAMMGGMGGGMGGPPPMMEPPVEAVVPPTPATRLLRPLRPLRLTLRPAAPAP